VLLIHGARIYAPSDLGQQDVLIRDGRIVAIESTITPPPEAEVMDGTGNFLVPGFIDNHVHTIGGGGEGGPATRAPRLQAGGLISCGITCAVGLLGVDGTSRGLEELYAHTLALREEGIGAYMLTGSFDVPTPTLTGNVRRDLFLIEPVIGVGEIAIGDHRSSVPSPEEVGRLAAEAIGGGRLVGKKSYINLHMGDIPGALDAIAEMLRVYGLPADRFLPTHVNRIQSLMEESARFGRLGGYLDLTTSIVPSEGYTKATEIPTAIAWLIESGIPEQRITVSSDGGGMTALRNDRGQIIGHRPCLPSGLLRDFKTMVGNGRDPGQAAAFFTSNVVDALGMEKRRGRVATGLAGDLLMFNDSCELQMVIAGGQPWECSSKENATWIPRG